jgi:hypothetical protein
MYKAYFLGSALSLKRRGLILIGPGSGEGDKYDILIFEKS